MHPNLKVFASPEAAVKQLKKMNLPNWVTIELMSCGTGEECYVRFKMA